MKPTKIFKIVAIIAVCVFLAKGSFATNLRGRIFRHMGNSNTPAENVRVDLMIFNRNLHVWQAVSYVLTGPNGFYYFLNFSPNQLFYISVNGKYYPPQQNPPTILSINPGSPPYYQDISPIIL